MNQVALILYASMVSWPFLMSAKIASPEDARTNRFINKDGSILTATLSSHRRAYDVTLTSSSREPLVIQSLPLEFENADMHSATALDLNGDGFGDIDLEGDCGNRACKHLVYLYDPATKRLHEALSKNFSTMARVDDMLILGSGSGCCAFEYEVLRLAPGRMRIDSRPEFYVDIESPDKPFEKSLCVFLDSNRRPIPPLKEFVELCSVFGPQFEMRITGT